MRTGKDAHRLHRSGSFHTEESRWLFSTEEVAESPSVADGLPHQVEVEMRERHARFMLEAGLRLHLPVQSVHVAVKLWQRFFMVESLRRHEPFHVSFACIFLSAKITEHFRNVSDVIYCCVKILTRHSKVSPRGEEVDESHPRFTEEKEKIFAKERAVLKAINFDVEISSAQGFLSDFRAFVERKLSLDHSRNMGIFQVANNLLNDSLLTCMHLRYSEEEIATACFYLAYAYIVSGEDGYRHTGSLHARHHQPPPFEKLLRVNKKKVMIAVDELLDMYA
mmetsp:Transcript_2194/g.6525  ORF Transcript_2194/g.6525 Transcript_2194/m.6525 type:complete len:279 (-) Transcript_2194:944-1780(-)